MYIVFHKKKRPITSANVDRFSLKSFTLGLSSDCVCEGLLFGNDESPAAQTAVRYEIEKHNNSTSTAFRLDKYEKFVDAADSFDVCKACEYRPVVDFLLFDFVCIKYVLIPPHSE